LSTYVQKGVQPYNHAGQPISPSDVVIKIWDIKNLIDQASTMVDDDVEAISVKARLHHANKSLAEAKGKDWTEYEMPDDETQARKLP
jgi:hypothetical protein